VDLAASLLELAVAVATEAGDLLLLRLHQARAEVGTKSSLTDMVTEMDRAAEELVVARLLAARPDDGVVGEEGSHRAGTSGVRWIVDPIDGTTNYLYRMPGFAVSVAAEVDGVVVAGVVVDPSHGEVFTATRGGGARCNGERVTASAAAALPSALVGTGFSYDPLRRRRQAAVLTQVLPCVRDIRRHGAASVDLCWTACGRFDAYYERGLQPWDLAAGALVATEAGALVGDLDGGPPSPAFVLAAAPAIFEPLRSLLASAGAGAA
jgi:myo-inositol-1(or 4)-monophosphatase